MNHDHYFLKPGFIIVPKQAVTISAVTGSGVSVCIFDKKKWIGGMNHFQLPFMATEGKTTAIYGNVATVTLIKMMLPRTLTSDANSHNRVNKHLEAQIFGGAYNKKRSDQDIGKQNIEIARKILSKYKIAIISEDTGGEKGRKIVFNISTNEAAVLKVDNLRNVDWYPYNG